MSEPVRFECRVEARGPDGEFRVIEGFQSQSRAEALDYACAMLRLYPDLEHVRVSIIKHRVGEPR